MRYLGPSFVPLQLIAENGRAERIAMDQQHWHSAVTTLLDCEGACDVSMMYRRVEMIMLPSCLFTKNPPTALAASPELTREVRIRPVPASYQVVF